MNAHAVTVNWNRCDICGQFIGFYEFMNGKAEHNLVFPDSEVTVETWETHHTSCAEPK